MAVGTRYNPETNTQDFFEDEISFVVETPIPNIISDRQFFQQLAVSGLITQSEALAAVTVGTLPAAIETFISALPDTDEFNARMILQGGTQFFRDNPLTAILGQQTGLDLDAFWRAAHEL